MKSKFVFFVVLSLTLLLAACNPVRQPSENNQVSPLSPLPTPLEAVTTGDTGAVRGILIHTSEKSGDRPVPEIVMSLAEIITNKEGSPRVAAYEASLAPTTLTDEQGRFVLNEIEPGLYGLVLDMITDVMLLDNPAETEEKVTLFIEVTAGDIVDLGELKYESLPIIGYME